MLCSRHLTIPYQLLIKVFTTYSYVRIQRMTLNPWGPPNERSLRKDHLIITTDSLLSRLTKIRHYRIKSVLENKAKSDTFE